MGELFEQIKIENLRELQAALRQIDGEAQKQLKDVFNTAADLVVNRARPKVPSRSGRARQSVRSRSGQRDAKVMGGSARASYYAWLDFGGRVGRRGSVRRQFIKGGRYIYPSYNEVQPQVFDTLQDALAALVRSSGLEVT